MLFDEYQKTAFSTAKYPDVGTGSPVALAYVGLGLGEAGEVQGKIKKIFRDDNSVVTEEKKNAILDEAADVLWYLAALCTEFKVPLSTLGERNLSKLYDRHKRGVIGGSGDNR